MCTIMNNHLQWDLKTTSVHYSELWYSCVVVVVVGCSCVAVAVTVACYCCFVCLLTTAVIINQPWNCGITADHQGHLQDKMQVLQGE